MKRRLASLVLAFTLLTHAAAVRAQTRSPEELTRRTIERRAIEAVIWGMPAVNAELMFQAVRDARADFNQVVFWSQPVGWKNQTLTPNPSTIYFMPFFNLKSAGPMVLEIPPVDGESSITGSIDEAWQTAIEDVGPAGADKGKGGKYLLLPPGYRGQVPAGYITLQSGTYAGFAILRSNFKTADAAGIARAVAYGKRVRFYPLSQAGNPPRTTFVDAINVVFDSTIPYDQRFFQALDRFVQREPWLTRDKVMIDQLKSIGIEKGKTFYPDGGKQKILADAAREARDWLDQKYVAHFATAFAPGAHWALPADQKVLAGLMTNFAEPDAYPVDGRGVGYSMGYFSAKHLGEGQFYLMTIADRAGKPLDGGRNYRLHVPPKAPVTLYWSATAYDRNTHALIREMKWSSRSSNTPGLKQNPDGSIDLRFGPVAPTSGESNWIPTNPRAGFEVLFRLYGPQPPFFDKLWKLPDLEEVGS